MVTFLYEWKILQNINQKKKKEDMMNAMYNKKTMDFLKKNIVVVFLQKSYFGTKKK